MFRLTKSIDIDIRLLPHDLKATRAHARVLRHAGLLEDKDVGEIDRACDDIHRRYDAGDLAVGPHDEDVHSLVERELTERLGDLGARIHAGRSRNDLVATDLRLATRDACDFVLASFREILSVIADRAEEQAHTVMPGYTHLQRAQPITVGFHLLAHGSALLRDVERFCAVREEANESALGAGALAGNTLGLDASVAAEELGMARVFDNAMDAVSQRDFVADFIYAAAMTELHLSRLAEEIVLWTSSEFGFARLADDWSTGSSMMPQKRNPDLAELLRGRAAGGVADITGILTLLKGLPLAYDRDLQEDKTYLFRTIERLFDALAATGPLLRTIRFDEERLLEAARGGASWATDLAEKLVVRGVPFRHAHEATGKLVSEIERRGISLEDAPVDLLKEAHPLFEEGDRAAADPALSVQARAGHGGPSKGEVERQISVLREKVGVIDERLGGSTH
jgi:argininosuccinate lyase